MTKKENDMFRKVYTLLWDQNYRYDGILKVNNFYYAVNKYMMIRSFEEPSLPIVPDDCRSAEVDESLERVMDAAIADSKWEVNLPTKKELVAFRKTCTREQMREKAYLLTAARDITIGVNINYLNMFLDVFGGRDCHCYTAGPVSTLYFVNERNGLNGILLPIRIRNYFNALNPEILYEKEGA